MKLSLIITVLNEEKTIQLLLNAIAKQTLKPSETIIVDGDSTDQTVKIIKQFQKKHSKLNLKLFFKKGNRSVGRNFAIKKSSNALIAITDAGCIPKKEWLQELVVQYQKTQAAVIAGFYQGKAKTAFEEAVIPYVLVMPDQVNKNNFLPATRSMLIEKTVWKQLKGFDEKLSLNEDYAFAKKMQKQQIKIAFAKKAIVEWMPRSSLEDYSEMIYRFAKGDIEAKILRPKVTLIFARYLLALFLLIFFFITGNNLLLVYLLFLAFLYIIWSILKNKKYCPNGWYWLPVLQIGSDLAVMFGSLSALM